MSASDTPVHTCSHSCQRPECMNAQRAELLDKLTAANAKLEEQAVRQREVERDANRYRWLRASDHLSPRDIFDVTWLMHNGVLNDLDAAIDAARSKS